MTPRSTYFGVTIWRKNSFGYALSWTAQGPNGQLAADTLAGIRELIRSEVKK